MKSASDIRRYARDVHVHLSAEHGSSIGLAAGAVIDALADIVERLDILIAQEAQVGPRSGEVHESPMGRLKRGESLRGEG